MSIDLDHYLVNTGVIRYPLAQQLRTGIRARVVVDGIESVCRIDAEQIWMIQLLPDRPPSDHAAAHIRASSPLNADEQRRWLQGSEDPDLDSWTCCM